MCLNAASRSVFVRATGSLIALAPPLTMEKKHIDQIVDALGLAIKESAAHKE
jgi:adenosylmethionine-8-amino-7-oxononanoate aminotransferase